MKVQPIFAILLCWVLCSSCSSILQYCYGIHNPQQMDSNTILRFAQKYKVPQSECYELDTSYNQFVKSLGLPIDEGPAKDHTQPLQALYYNSTNELVSFYNNCYAGGFPNLKWDRNGNMFTFPPQQQVPLDTLLPLQTQLRFIKPISQTKQLDLSQHDYVVLVFWNRFMGRQSKRLIRSVQHNCDRYRGGSVKIVYVNNDNLFAND